MEEEGEVPSPLADAESEDVGALMSSELPSTEVDPPPTTGDPPKKLVPDIELLMP